MALQRVIIPNLRSFLRTPKTLPGRNSSGFPHARNKSKTGRKRTMVVGAAITAAVLNLFALPAVAVDASSNADLSLDKAFVQNYQWGQWTAPNPPMTTLDPTQNTLSAVINFTNNGPGATNNVVVTDPIPAGWTVYEASYQGQGGDGTTGPVNGNQCTINAPTAQYPNGSITCEIWAVGPWQPNTPIPAGFTAQIQIVGSVNPNDCTTGSITNTAFVTGDGTDPNLANNTATATVGKGGCQADLSVAATPSNQSVTPGTDADITVTASNYGPGPAPDTQVTTTLPAALTPDTAAMPTNCAAADQTVTCDLGNLPAPAVAQPTLSAPSPAVTTPTTASVTIPVTLNPNQTTPVTVTASVASETTDPNQANNTTSVTITPASASADVRVTAAAPATVQADGSVAATVTVVNDGPSAATNVKVDTTVTNLVDSVVTSSVDSAGNAVGTICSGGTCDLGKMASGAVATITVLGTAPDVTSGTESVDISATATSGTADPAPANNTATATTTVTPVETQPAPAVADLSITNTATDYTAGNPATPDDTDPTTGDPIPDTGTPATPATATWTILAVNNGPATANDVTVKAEPVGDTQITSASSAAGTCTVADGAATCNLDSLAPSASATVTVSGESTSTTDPNQAPLTVAASGSTSTHDPNPANNNASDTATAVQTITPNTPTADVAVTTTAAEPTASPGGQVTYTVTATNDGPDTAQNVIVTTTLPTGITPDGSTGQTVTTNLGPIDSGASASTTVIGTVNSDTPAGTLDASSVVTSDALDSNLGNNVSTAPVDITIPPTPTPATDLEVTATPGNQPVTPGSDVTVNVTATNNGPADALNPVVTVTLPPGITPVAVSQDGTVAGQTVTVDLGANDGSAVSVLASGASVPITVIGKLSPDITSTTPLPITATISSATTTVTPDTNPANNTATAYVTPSAPVADVAVTNVAPATATPGTHVTSIITVTNDGPSTAKAVVVTDALAASLTGVKAQVVGGTTSAGAPAVTASNMSAQLGDLAPGATVTLAVTGTVAPNTPAGTLVNTATATSPTTDQAPANNTAPARTVLAPNADLGMVNLVSASEIAQGGNVQWGLTVTNYGQSTANDVVITDQVPVPQATMTAATLTVGGTSRSCTITAGTMTCPNIPTMAPGTYAKVAIQGRVSTSIPVQTRVINTARVGAVTADSVMPNNTMNSVFTVLGRAVAAPPALTSTGVNLLPLVGVTGLLGLGGVLLLSARRPQANS